MPETPVVPERISRAHLRAGRRESFSGFSWRSSQRSPSAPSARSFSFEATTRDRIRAGSPGRSLPGRARVVRRLSPGSRLLGRPCPRAQDEDRTTRVGTFVRYLPPSAQAGDPGTALTIATYPLRNAYATAYSPGRRSTDGQEISRGRHRRVEPGEPDEHLSGVPGRPLPRRGLWAHAGRGPQVRVVGPRPTSLVEKRAGDAWPPALSNRPTSARRRRPGSWSGG